MSQDKKEGNIFIEFVNWINTIELEKMSSEEIFHIWQDIKKRTSKIS